MNDKKVSEEPSQPQKIAELARVATTLNFAMEQLQKSMATAAGQRKALESTETSIKDLEAQIASLKSKLVVVSRSIV